MPDVTLVVHGLTGAEDAERLERALSRLNFVHHVNVDGQKSLLAVSYAGGKPELDKIERAVKETGHEFKPSPGAEEV